MIGFSAPVEDVRPASSIIPSQQEYYHDENNELRCVDGRLVNDWDLEPQPLPLKMTMAPAEIEWQERIFANIANGTFGNSATAAATEDTVWQADSLYQAIDQENQLAPGMPSRHRRSDYTAQSTWTGAGPQSRRQGMRRQEQQHHSFAANMMGMRGNGTPNSFQTSKSLTTVLANYAVNPPSPRLHGLRRLHHHQEPAEGSNWRDSHFGLDEEEEGEVGFVSHGRRPVGTYREVVQQLLTEW